MDYVLFVVPAFDYSLIKSVMPVTQSIPLSIFFNPFTHLQHHVNVAVEVAYTLTLALHEISLNLVTL